MLRSMQIEAFAYIADDDMSAFHKADDVVCTNEDRLGGKLWEFVLVCIFKGGRDAC
jgi:hypothetical protein